LDGTEDEDIFYILTLLTFFRKKGEKIAILELDEAKNVPDVKGP